jgi:hypothetical protein
VMCVVCGDVCGMCMCEGDKVTHVSLRTNMIWLLLDIGNYVPWKEA